MPTPKPNLYIEGLVPYLPGLPVEALARHSGLSAGDIVKIASNENPYGMSPRVRAVLRASAGEGHRYPDPHVLTQALAVHTGLAPTQVVVGNGSNDVLDLVARTFLAPGDEAVSSQYAFAIYQIVTQSTGARNIVVPATPGFGHDLAGMLSAITPRTRVVWLANPNNPTGTFIPYPELKSFIEQVPEHVIVVLDEAYFEYLDPAAQTNTPAWIATHPNLIITRTFSKVYGLAGLRIGYALAHPTVAGLLNRVRQPFNTGTLALSAAVAALADQAYVRLSSERNRRGRRGLEAGLRQLGISFIPSAGNFLTAHIPDAATTYERLLERGVITRPLGGYGLPDHLRITVGRPAENARLLTALAATLGAQTPRTAKAVTVAAPPTVQNQSRRSRG
jgi:histidinol-phosphate aminotransferase